MQRCLNCFIILFADYLRNFACLTHQTLSGDIKMYKVLGHPCVITTVSGDAKEKIAKIKWCRSCDNIQDGKVLDEIKKTTKNELCDVVFAGVGLKTHEESMLSVEIQQRQTSIIAFFTDLSFAVKTKQTYNDIVGVFTVNVYLFL